MGAGLSDGQGPAGSQASTGAVSGAGGRAGAQSAVPTVLLDSLPLSLSGFHVKPRPLGEAASAVPGRQLLLSTMGGRAGQLPGEPWACSGGEGGRPWGGSPTLPPVPGSLPGVPLPLCEALGRAVVGQAQAVVPWCPGQMPGPAPPAQLLARCTLRGGQCWASSQSVFSSSKKDLGVGDGHQDLETSSVDLWLGPSLLVLNNGPKSGTEPGAKEK